jgi:hypothetical protein
MTDVVRPVATWRKALAAVVDFLTVFFVGGYVIGYLTGNKRAWKSAGDAGNISPMEPYLLLVTLVLGQQAPHSYKVEFSSKETCEQAASDLRLNYNKTFRNITGVMTVCAKK